MPHQIVILRTLELCGDTYEKAHHLAISHSVGLTEPETEAILAGDARGLDDQDAVLLRAAEELHRDPCIAEPTWSAMADRYSLEQQMDAVYLAGCFQTVAMLTKTFGIELEPDLERSPRFGTRAADPASIIEHLGAQSVAVPCPATRSPPARDNASVAPTWRVADAHSRDRSQSARHQPVRGVVAPGQVPVPPRASRERQTRPCWPLVLESVLRGRDGAHESLVDRAGDRRPTDCVPVSTTSRFLRLWASGAAWRCRAEIRDRDQRHRG